jgi:autotransporter-associated beta strand protein
LGGASGNWGDSSWSSSAAGDVPTGGWTSGKNAVFGANAIYTVTVSGTQTASTLTFSDGAVTLSGGQINFSGGISVASGKTATINSVLAGNAGLNKTGAGTLILGGANSYSGVTTVSAGTLRLANAAALGSGNVTLAGGTLLHDFTHYVQYVGKTVTLTANSAVGASSGQQIDFGGTLAGGGKALTITGGGIFYLGEGTNSVSAISSIIVNGNSSLGAMGTPPAGVEPLRPAAGRP